MEALYQLSYSPVGPDNLEHPRLPLANDPSCPGPPLAAYRVRGREGGTGTIRRHGREPRHPHLRGARDRGALAGAVADRGHLRGRQRRPPTALLRAQHVPVPVGSGPHGPRPELHVRRPHRPLPHHGWLRGAQPDRLRQLRPAGRERRHQDRRAPAHVHRRPHRGADLQPPAHRRRLRLAPPRHQPRSRLHPLDPVDLPALPRGGPGLPRDGPGELVPRVPDRAGQRAGPGRRHLRALGRPRADARPRAVVLPHHRLRPGAARRPRLPRVARPRRHDAAQLDRPLRRRRVHDGGHRRRRDAHRRVVPRVHDPSRHGLRHDVLRARPRAPAGARDHDRGPPRRRRGLHRARPVAPPRSIGCRPSTRSTTGAAPPGPTP